MPSSPPGGGSAVTVCPSLTVCASPLPIAWEWSHGLLTGLGATVTPSTRCATDAEANVLNRTEQQVSGRLRVGQAAVAAIEPLLHLRGGCRSGRRLLEHDHQAITEVLHLPPTMTGHDRPQQREVLDPQFLRRLRAHTRRQRRGPDQLGEHHRSDHQIAMARTSAAARTGTATEPYPEARLSAFGDELGGRQARSPQPPDRHQSVWSAPAAA